MNRRDLFKVGLLAPVCSTSLFSIACSSDTATKTIFARWYCDLNGWRWPKDWGRPPERFRYKLEDLHGPARYEYCKEEYGCIMNLLRQFAGQKECLRVSNVERRKAMTPDQFERWWRNRHE